MRLSPREIDHLLLHQVGFVAQKRLARGVRLNHPEAVALIATVTMEFIRDGERVATLMDKGKQLLGLNQVMPGVAELVDEVQVEGTFPDGTKLVTVHQPICQADGNLALALYGSFLPVPDVSLFGASETEDLIPGQYITGSEPLEINPGRERTTIPVTNTADRPIQVGSHYHFGETNRQLSFDRVAAYGKRLDIAAGTAVRFEPGETKTVHLIEIAGNKIIQGGNNLGSGPVSDHARTAFSQAVSEQNFGHEGDN